MKCIFKKYTNLHYVHLIKNVEIKMNLKAYLGIKKQDFRLYAFYINILCSNLKIFTFNFNFNCSITYITIVIHLFYKIKWKRKNMIIILIMKWISNEYSNLHYRFLDDKQCYEIKTCTHSENLHKKSTYKLFKQIGVSIPGRVPPQSSEIFQASRFR